MRPLTITQSKIISFNFSLIRPFSFAGYTLTERAGYYFELIGADGLTAQGETAPLPGKNSETLKKAKHDLELFQMAVLGWQVPVEKMELIEKIKADSQLGSFCASARFGLESAFFTLAAQATNLGLNKYLGSAPEEMASAALLQGTHEQVLSLARQMWDKGFTVFKLKVGDRNVALDVKKVQDLRRILGKTAVFRLDGNGVWSLSEAVLFVQLAGLEQIEFIEEPFSDMSRLGEFYQATGMPVALDETLSGQRCGITAPGRCSPTLSSNEGVAAYVIKPMVLGGVVMALDWIEEARRLGKKAIISSSFESPVGLKVLKALAGLTGQPAGLGTEHWF